jgi:hypothetical protein
MDQGRKKDHQQDVLEEKRRNVVSFSQKEVGEAKNVSGFMKKMTSVAVGRVELRITLQLHAIVPRARNRPEEGFEV